MKVLAALVESIIVAHHGRPMLSYVGIKIIKKNLAKESLCSHEYQPSHPRYSAQQESLLPSWYKCDFQGVADTGVSHNLHDN